MKYCVNCGASMSDEARFCSKCGSPCKTPKNKNCQNCGYTNENENNFCSNCGVRLNFDPVFGNNTAQNHCESFLEIVWQKEIKNSVPFLVTLNGMPQGTIKRGETLTCRFPGNTINLVFVPKAPKWYGWKTLTIEADVVNPGEVCQLLLGILYHEYDGILPNLNGQLHTNKTDNIAIRSEIQTK